MSRRDLLRSSVAALLVFALAGAFGVAHAATRTWTGASSPLWSDAGNWGGVAIATGDDLVFPEAATNKVSSNDTAAGTSYASITVNGGHMIGGNAVTLTSPNALTFGAAAPASILFNATVTVTHAAAAIASSQADSILLNVALGAVVIDGGALTLAIAGDHATVSIGSITETAVASITKDGNGYAELEANNTYSGRTTVNEGYLGVAASGALGAGTNTAADGTVVNPGGTIYLVGVAVVANERLVLNGSGQSGQGAFQNRPFLGPSARSWGGEIVLNTPGVVFNLFGPLLTVAGKVTGPGDLQIASGLASIANPLNDYAGATLIGSTTFGAPWVTLGANEVIPNGSAVRLFSNSILDLNGKVETIGSLAGAGFLVTNGGALTTGGNNESTSFDGDISGSGLVNKVGTGTWTLTGNTSFAGGFGVGGGTVAVNGQLGGTVGIGSGATLAGTGRVDTVVTSPGGDGVIAPGGASPGVLTVGSLTIREGNTLRVRLDGLAAGTQYDQLSVAGNATLGGSLSVVPGFAPPVGAVFRIIDATGPASVTGTFDGMAEGAVFSVGATTMKISYAGGTGNDVTLTVTATAGSPSQSIPTLGPWGLVLLATLAVLGGGLATRRRP